MDINAIAHALRMAENSKVPMAPVRNIIGTDDLDLAYSIQKINTDLRVKEGARITGKKIGLTSKAVQIQLGVDQPDFGVLFSDREILNGQSIALKNVMQAKVEAEIAFVLAYDLDFAPVTITDLIEAIDYALPAIEIAGSRIADWDIQITDTIADNASASHYVLGHSPRAIDSFDMVECNMEMSINGKIVSEGTGAACMGSPLNAVYWLAHKMYDMGTPLLAGEIILSGALGKFADVSAGDEVLATISGLGSVSVNFE
jgi:2-keto-4-pentenoate hydratase